MKNKILDMINYIKHNPKIIIMILLSIAILIVGSFIINFFIVLIAAILINLLWIIPYIKRAKKKPKEKTKEKPKKEKNIEKPDLYKPMESSDNMAKKKKVNKKKIGKIILLVLLSIFIFILLLGIAFVIYIAVSADKFDPDKLYTKEASTLYDSDGKQFAQLGSEMREKIKYDEMSESLINAIVATEDSRFFQHNGFDLPRFLKASLGQVAGNSGAGGASTLTMQVSKNQLTSTTSSGFAGIKRKFTDIYSSIFQIESNYTKEEILEFYANSYYLGSGAYGVEQAAKTYFKKSAKDLNISEAAMIAGLFQSPVAYDPNLNPDKTEKRRLTVLKLMKRHGYINENEYKIAKKMTVDRIVIKGGSAYTDSSQYQGFIDTVAVEVKERTGYDPYSYSMKIYTTMDRAKQDEVNKIMNGTNYSWENDRVDAGVAVVETKTGEIVAVGAGRNSTGAKGYNKATMMKRQIGSTAKPLFDYGPAVEYLGWNPYHPIIDNKHTYSDGTEINNWDGRYKGIITIREALVDSRNIPALKTFQSLKNSDIKNFVTSLGLHPEVMSDGKLHEAHAIGGYTGESPLDVAAAYAAFANNGYYNDPHSFTKVVFDKDDETIEVDGDKTKVMSKDTAYMVTDMLVDTGQNALGKYNNINGSEFAAKTGTSNFDEKTIKARRLPNSAVNDLWVAGYNDEYSIAVWYGYEDLNKGYNRFGSSQNSKLFQAVAKNFFKSDVKFTKPDTIQEVTVEKYCGYPLLPSSGTPDGMKTKELFTQDSVPTEVSNRYNKLTNVTNVSGEVKGGRDVVLSWKAISTPDALNRTYWSPIVNKAFAISKDQTTYLNYIMGINERTLGKVIYNIYLKTSSGLTKVTSTDKNTATIRLPITASPSYIIKTSYSGYGGCESSGVEVKVNYNGLNANNFEKKLVGEENIGKNKEITTWTDVKHPINVTLDGEDLSSEVTVTATVTKDKAPYKNYKSGETITLTEPGEYEIKYKVSYNNINIGELTRYVKISEESDS